MRYVKFIGVANNDIAREIFKIMYPAGNSTGNEQTMRAALRRTLKAVGTKTYNVVPLNLSGTSGNYEHDDYIMIWNYAYNWIAVYKKMPSEKLVSA